MNAQKIRLQAEKREMLSREVTLLPLWEVFPWPESRLIYLMKWKCIYSIKGSTYQECLYHYNYYKTFYYANSVFYILKCIYFKIYYCMPKIYHRLLTNNIEIICLISHQSFTYYNIIWKHYSAMFLHDLGLSDYL